MLGAVGITGLQPEQVAARRQLARMQLRLARPASKVSADMIQRKAVLSLAGAIVTSLILVYFVTLDYSRNILPKRISYNPPLSYDTRNTSATGPEKAAFVILARNSDLGQILTSIQAVEDRFNNRHGHHYPYVFLSACRLSHGPARFAHVYLRRRAILA